MARRTPRRAAGRNATRLRFNQQLVVQQWLLGLFGVDSFEALATILKRDELEGLDEENIHRFHRTLCLHLPAADRPEMSDLVLREFEERIASLTLEMNEHRATNGEQPLVWKYFQYLALLFTEVYLERYFADASALLLALNARIRAFNEGKDPADQVDCFDESAEAWPQLNKIAFWMATGSGKTLLMHAHIRQYRAHLERRGRTRELNRVILLTPNEGLSRQHKREFDRAGIPAELFTKENPGLFAGRNVEILEVTKLKEKSGDKTVAVEAFEGNNLVLVDEGHRGTSGGGDGTWITNRDKLCERGFSFEYSATFGQVVAGQRGLLNRYARAVLFDYSYRWFYGDGYGKDYEILNLAEERDADWMDKYLTACLLAFFQQQRVFAEHAAEVRAFQIERPLWVFVGSSVTASLDSREASDIVEILRFLSGYVANRARSVEHVRAVLHDGLLTQDGRNLFEGRYRHLNGLNRTPEQVFEETLALLFNAPSGGALHVEHLKGSEGEIALRVGENEPFGVINVGDAKKLTDKCEQAGLLTATRDFAGSLFHQLERADSTVNVLVGSKKFTEGWNSYRVSTMGLMNVGRSEGAQIIQLFGRGVRLKGYATSLMRSACAPLPDDVKAPAHLRTLETLHIFGVHADYMQQFREFLEKEGLPTDTDRIEIILPIVRNLGRQQLKVIRLKREINGIHTDSKYAFRRLGPVPTLLPPSPQTERATEYLQKNLVTLNWYPKIQALKSLEPVGEAIEERPHSTVFSPQHLAFLDLDRLHLELERFKAERDWHNLNLTREGIRALLTDATWYRIEIPATEMAFDSFDKVRLWAEIALTLLKKYTERYYTFRKRLWEQPHLEYRALEEDDNNFPTAVGENGPEPGYRVLLEKSQQEIADKLLELRADILAGRLRPFEFRGIAALHFERHLYQPLLAMSGARVEISPAPLNEGERRFVEDLQAYHAAHPDRFGSRDLYLLRNLSRGRGVGFFEAGNFHPDFLVWQLEGEKQRVAFVDPKGLRHVPWGDPKVSFHETVKKLQAHLGDENVELESFLVSNTPSQVMRRVWGVEKDDMARRHVLFQEEDRATYVAALLGHQA